MSDGLRLFIGYNFFGSGNFGDDLMIDGFLRALATSGTKHRISACTAYDIESQRRRFPAIAWYSDDEVTRARERERADVWVGIGATPFQLASGPWFLDLLDREREACEARELPMVLLGVGVESAAALEDERAQRLARACARIWTRDGYSRDRLAPVVAPATVSTGADLAHIVLAANARLPREHGVLGLMLGFEDPGTVDFGDLEAGLQRRGAGTTRWLVQEARAFPYTERWNFAERTDAAKAGVRLMQLEYALDSIDDFLVRFGASEVVVSTRYHAALIAAWHGSRIVAIERSAKIGALAADLGVPTLPHLRGTDALDGALALARAPQRETLATLASRASAMGAEFSAWLAGKIR